MARRGCTYYIHVYLAKVLHLYFLCLLQNYKDQHYIYVSFAAKTMLRWHSVIRDSIFLRK